MPNQIMNVMNSTVVSSINLWRGTNAEPARIRPKKILELYDMEGCPYCRLVREALTELDLEAKIFPCPKGGTRFRTEVKALGGKLQFPFLIDPNTGKMLYESSDIISYLFKTYGKRAVPLKWRLMPLQKASSALATLMRSVRTGAGIKRRAAKPVKKPMELYSFESSPYSRPVRELLCELEIPYLLHNVGKRELADFVLPGVRKKLLPNRTVKGVSRKGLVARGGKMMVPFLVDPNRGVKLYESANILNYLLKTYAKS
jgi:glutathione S-transferase